MTIVATHASIIPHDVQRRAVKKWEKILKHVQACKTFRGDELAWGPLPWLFGNYVLDTENDYLSYCREFLQRGEDEENVCEMCPLNMVHCQLYPTEAPQATFWRFVRAMRKPEPDWPHAEKLAKMMLARIKELG